MYDIKQVIVVRTKYPDGNGGFRKLRTGKIAAQVAHASLSFISKELRRKGKIEFMDLSNDEQAWFAGSFAKVVVYVNSEEELLQVYKKALDEGLTAHLITDAGKTEFAGQPTNTCIAVGPHKSIKFAGITSDLPLL